MKNFKMKQVHLSKNADMKIRIRLYIAKCKKNLEIATFIKFALPTFVMGIFAIGVFQVLDTNQTSIQTPTSTNIQASSTFTSDHFKEIRSNKYRTLAKKRAYAQKAKKYKNYAYVRSSSLRVR